MSLLRKLLGGGPEPESGGAGRGPLIKNAGRRPSTRDFELGAVGLALAALLVAFSVAARLLSGARPSPLAFGALLGAPILATATMTLFPRWSAALKFVLLALVASAAWASLGAAGADAGLALAFAAVGAFVAPSVQRLAEWERGIVLRFGKFRRVRGPGLFVLFPVADKLAETVDLRIRVTDFSAETTLTRDSVTVTVDALCFWLVWDAEKAVLEVEDYEEAVILSAKTALRAAVSKHDLSVFLESGEAIEERIRAEVDRKTTDWGVTVQHIEITDIQIPEQLQDSLSRLAQAEREKKGRILLAEAEIEIAKRYEEAARVYAANPTALKLKSLSILNEGLKAGNSMMLVPDSITEELKSNDIFGLQALNELRRDEQASSGKGTKQAAPDGRGKARS
ncbi:MAG TPA: slipin family protein [Spirochaetales bacterium]|nr:slipin family protein [Spirochaetales bacterium]